MSYEEQIMSKDNILAYFRPKSFFVSRQIQKNLSYNFFGNLENQTALYMSVVVHESHW